MPYKKIILVLGAIALVSGTLAYAQPLTPPTPVTSVDQIQTGVICKILGWIFTIAIILSILFLLIAAIRYITSGGNPEKRSEINRAIIFAVVGIAVAILARGVPSILSTFFGGGALDPCPSLGTGGSPSPNPQPPGGGGGGIPVGGP